AVLLARLGLWTEAAGEIEAARKLVTSATPACEAADLWTNFAWISLLERESPQRSSHLSTPAPGEFLAQVAKALDNGCTRPDLRANLYVNRALAALQEGDPAAGKAALQDARAMTQPPGAEIAVWAADLDARIAVARGEWPEALGLYDRLLHLSQAGGFV